MHLEENGTIGGIWCRAFAPLTTADYRASRAGGGPMPEYGLPDYASRSRELTNSIAEIGRREAQQRRTMAQAAERQLNQASDAVKDIAAEIEFFETNLKPDEEARLVIIGGPAGTAIFP